MDQVWVAQLIDRVRWCFFALASGRGSTTARTDGGGVPKFPAGQWGDCACLVHFCLHKQIGPPGLLDAVRRLPVQTPAVFGTFVRRGRSIASLDAFWPAQFDLLLVYQTQSRDRPYTCWLCRGKLYGAVGRPRLFGAFWPAQTNWPPPGLLDAVGRLPVQTLAVFRKVVRRGRSIASFLWWCFARTQFDNRVHSDMLFLFGNLPWRSCAIASCFVCLLCFLRPPPNVRGRLPDCSNNYRTKYDSTTGTRVPVRKRRNRRIASNGTKMK